MGIMLASSHAIFPEKCTNARHWDLLIFFLSPLRFARFLAEDSSDGEFTVCQAGRECSVSAHLPLFKGKAAGAQSGLGHSAGSRPNVEDPELDPGSFPESSCQVLYPPCGHCHRDDMTGVLFCFFILAEQGQWGLDDVVGK